jgi:hypothetical protein
MSVGMSPTDVGERSWRFERATASIVKGEGYYPRWDGEDNTPDNSHFRNVGTITITSGGDFLKKWRKIGILNELCFNI